MSIKFSLLPQADTPLNGDEILCIVQDGISKQVASGDVSGAAADPTAFVGLAAVPGAAVTLMRSDAAPALDQGIEPVWTGLHEFQAPVLVSAEDDGDVGSLTIASDVPSFELADTSQAANSSRWKWSLGFDDFPFMSLDLLSGAGAVQATPLFISRNGGGNVNEIVLEALAGGISLSGDSVALFVNAGGDSSLALSSNGAWGVGPAINRGLAGQVLQSNGPAAAPSWINVGLSAVEQAIAPAAGTNNDVAIAAQRVLVNTAAGIATITGIVAAANGTLALLTNTGANDMVLAVENVLSAAANRFYGVADITIISHGSKLISYSATLARWVLV